MLVHSESLLVAHAVNSLALSSETWGNLKEGLGQIVCHNLHCVGDQPSITQEERAGKSPVSPSQLRSRSADKLSSPGRL